VNAASPFDFGPFHPLAEVAARHCRPHPIARRIGGVACGECWELAIRDDERVVVEYDLPRQLTADPSYVDDIAVELACAGESVPLTRPERRAAEVLMRARGWPLARIADHLRTCRRRPIGPVANATAARLDRVAA
jgi:hypothetical protein